MNDYKFWKTEWIIFGLMSLTLVSTLYFMTPNHNNFKNTFIVIIISIILIFSKAYMNEGEREELFKNNIYINKKNDKTFMKLLNEIKNKYKKDLEKIENEIIINEIKNIGPAFFYMKSDKALSVIYEKIQNNFDILYYEIINDKINTDIKIDIEKNYKAKLKLIALYEILNLFKNNANEIETIYKRQKEQKI